MHVTQRSSMREAWSAPDRAPGGGGLPWIDWAWLVAALATLGFWTAVVVLVSAIV